MDSNGYNVLLFTKSTPMKMGLIYHICLSMVSIPITFLCMKKNQGRAHHPNYMILLQLYLSIFIVHALLTIGIQGRHLVSYIYFEPKDVPVSVNTCFAFRHTNYSLVAVMSFTELFITCERILAFRMGVRYEKDGCSFGVLFAIIAVRDFNCGGRGFENRFDKYSKDGTKGFWRCINRVCKARAIGDADSPIIVRNEKSADHIHVPPPSKEQIRISLSEAKEEAKTNKRKTTRDVAADANKNLDDDAINLMPKRVCLMRTINNARFVKGNEHVNSKEAKNIAFYPELLEFQNGSILLHDSRAADPNSDVFLIFGSQSALNRLSVYRHWAADGTFSVCPQSFQQLYTINVLIERSALPCLYIVTERRTTATYERIFTEVKKLIGSLSDPLSIITDFEKGAQTAAANIWPTVTVRSCLFHLSQSVYRQVGTLGISDLYLNNKAVKKTVRSLSALSFLMPHEIPSGFSVVRRAAEVVHPQLTSLFNYFQRTYVGDTQTNALFPPLLWSCHDTIGTHLGRTNNAIEGWHHAFRGRFSYDHPKLSTLIEAIISEEEDVRNRLARYRMKPNEGISIKKRLVKYQKVDEEIEKYVEDFDQQPTTPQNLLEHLTVLQYSLSSYDL